MNTGWGGGAGGVPGRSGQPSGERGVLLTRAPRGSVQDSPPSFVVPSWLTQLRNWAVGDHQCMVRPYTVLSRLGTGLGSAPHRYRINRKISIIRFQVDTVSNLCHFLLQKRNGVSDSLCWLGLRSSGRNLGNTWENGTIKNINTCQPFKNSNS